MAEAGGMSGSEQEQDEQVYYHQQQVRAGQRMVGLRVLGLCAV